MNQVLDEDDSHGEKEGVVPFLFNYQMYKQFEMFKLFTAFSMFKTA